MGNIMGAFLKGIDLCLRQTDTPTYDKNYAAEVSLMAVVIVFLLEVAAIAAAMTGVVWVIKFLYAAMAIVGMTCAGLLANK